MPPFNIPDFCSPIRIHVFIYMYIVWSFQIFLLTYVYVHEATILTDVLCHRIHIESIEMFNIDK